MLQIGIVFGQGVRATIDHNKISGNAYNPACGPDFFNQIQVKIFANGSSLDRLTNQITVCYNKDKLRRNK
jgi:hypothetical protein